MYQFVVTTVEPLHNGRFGDRRKRPLWRGGRYGEIGPLHDICFSGLSKLMLTVSHNYGNPVWYLNIEIGYTKDLNYVLNQNFNVKKRERFETFAISIMRK